MIAKCTENKNVSNKRKYTDILDNKQSSLTLFKCTINTQDNLF